jgi:hypothetical protein
VAGEGVLGIIPLTVLENIGSICFS